MEDFKWLKSKYGSDGWEWYYRQLKFRTVVLYSIPLLILLAIVAVPELNILITLLLQIVSLIIVHQIVKKDIKETSKKVNSFIHWYFKDLEERIRILSK